MAYCYILRCGEGSYYVGSTEDLGARFTKHQDGSASAYTSARRPVRLVYAEEFGSIERARARERQIKRWTRAKKTALIAGDRVGLKLLGQSSIRRLRGKVKWTGALEASRLDRVSHDR